MKPELKRFEKHIDRHSSQTGCWLWTGSLNWNGYGYFYPGPGRTVRVERAHRASWRLFCGMIPEGFLVLHRCDIRRCVNPDHLYLGTTQDNTNDRDSRGRHWVRSGEDHGMSKLTAAKVREIRATVGYWGVKRRLAKRFKVSESLICSIRNGKGWARRSSSRTSNSNRREQ